MNLLGFEISEFTSLLLIIICGLWLVNHLFFSKKKKQNKSSQFSTSVEEETNEDEEEEEMDWDEERNRVVEKMIERVKKHDELVGRYFEAASNSDTLSEYDYAKLVDICFKCNKVA